MTDLEEYILYLENKMKSIVNSRIVVDKSDESYEFVKKYNKMNQSRWKLLKERRDYAKSFLLSLNKKKGCPDPPKEPTPPPTSIYRDWTLINQDEIDEWRNK